MVVFVGEGERNGSEFAARVREELVAGTELIAEGE